MRLFRLQDAKRPGILNVSDELSGEDRASRPKSLPCTIRITESLAPVMTFLLQVQHISECISECILEWQVSGMLMIVLVDLCYMVG
jgi:hypothetical protein